MNTAPSYPLSKSVIVSCCFLLFPFLTFAQTRGKVEVIKDPLIDTLISRRPSLGKAGSAGGETTNGYRVQIFFGSNRQAAYNAQAKILKRNTLNYPTYIFYTEPNFKVHAGGLSVHGWKQKKLQKESNSYVYQFIYYFLSRFKPA